VLRQSAAATQRGYGAQRSGPIIAVGQRPVQPAPPNCLMCTGIKAISRPRSRETVGTAGCKVSTGTSPDKLPHLRRYCIWTLRRRGHLCLGDQLAAAAPAVSAAGTVWSGPIAAPVEVDVVTAQRGPRLAPLLFLGPTTRARVAGQNRKLSWRQSALVAITSSTHRLTGEFSSRSALA